MGLEKITWSHTKSFDIRRTRGLNFTLNLHPQPHATSKKRIKSQQHSAKVNRERSLPLQSFDSVKTWQTFIDRYRMINHCVMSDPCILTGLPSFCMAVACLTYIEIQLLKFSMHWPGPRDLQTLVSPPSWKRQLFVLSWIRRHTADIQSRCRPRGRGLGCEPFHCASPRPSPKNLTNHTGGCG